MSINGIGPGRTPYEQLKIQQDREREELAGGVKNPAQEGDEVSVSGDGRLLATAHDAANEASGMREDKVARLKAMVQNGTYKPDGRLIAEKIVSEELDLWQ